MNDKVKLLEKYKKESDFYATVFNSFSHEKFSDLDQKLSVILNSVTDEEKNAKLNNLENTKLGNYIFLDILEETNLKVSYIAKRIDKANQNIVQITLSKISSLNQITEERLIELNLLKRFQSKDIVNLIDCGYIKNFNALYEIHEYIPGQNLGVLLKEGENQFKKLPLEVILYLGAEVSLAQKKINLHNRTPFNMVFKGPEIMNNIFFNHKGEFAIKDLMIPYYCFNKEYCEELLKVNNTDLFYCPDYLSHKVHIPKSDQFKMALYLVQLIMGKNIFSLMTTAEFTQEKLFEVLDTELAQHTDELRDTFKTALSFSYENRFEHLEVFSKKLKELCTQVSEDFDHKKYIKFMENTLNEHKLEWILKEMFYAEVDDENPKFQVDKLENLDIYPILMEDNRDSSWSLV